MLHAISGRFRHRWVLSIFGLFSLVLSGGARGDAFSNYRKIGSFFLPAGSAMFDTLPDGRLMTLSGVTIYEETAVGSGNFSAIGNLAGADFPSFGAAFLRVSPDGSRFAVGNNGGTSSGSQVGVFSLPGLSGVWFNAPHFDAAWVDNHRIALSYRQPPTLGKLSVLDADSSSPTSPDNRPVIDGVGGYSGGVAIDAQGNLYTANGSSDGGPSGTGAIKAFLNSQWEAAYAASTPLNFENHGILIGEILSAAPLAFDLQGNLVVAGGDFVQSGERGYVALVRESALAAALIGQGPVDSANPAQVRRLDPDPENDFDFYYAVASGAFPRIYMKDFGDVPVHVYFDTTDVPAASTWGVINLALLTTIAGSITLLRRGSNAV